MVGCLVSHRCWAQVILVLKQEGKDGAEVTSTLGTVVSSYD